MRPAGRRLPPLLLLLLLLARPAEPLHAHTAAGERAPESAEAFFARLRERLLGGGGFRARFEAEGPGGFRGRGTLSFRIPVKARIDLADGPTPLAWVQNGERVFLRVGEGRVFHLPASAADATRLPPLPPTAAALEAACRAALRGPRLAFSADFTGYTLEGGAAGGAAFRLECDRECVPRSFTLAPGGGGGWKILFTDFRAEAPDPSLFEPKARAVFDLYR